MVIANLLMGAGLLPLLMVNSIETVWIVYLVQGLGYMVAGRLALVLLRRVFATRHAAASPVELAS